MSRRAWVVLTGAALLGISIGMYVIAHLGPVNCVEPLIVVDGQQVSCSGSSLALPEFLLVLVRTSRLVAVIGVITMLVGWLAVGRAGGGFNPRVTSYRRPRG